MNAKIPEDVVTCRKHAWYANRLHPLCQRKQSNQVIQVEDDHDEEEEEEEAGANVQIQVQTDPEHQQDIDDVPMNWLSLGLPGSSQAAQNDSDQTTIPGTLQHYEVPPQQTYYDYHGQYPA